MATYTATNEWSGLAFRGIVAILFGVAAVFWPELTIKTLVYLFGGFVLASGLATLISSLVNINNIEASFLMRLLMVLVGMVEIGVGVYLLRHPLVTFTTFILIIGFTLIFRGVVEICSGLFEARGAMHKTLLITGGLIAGIAGVVLLFQPASGGIAFVWILGLYSLLAGAMMIALAMDIKNLNELPTGTRATAKARR